MSLPYNRARLARMFDEMILNQTDISLADPSEPNLIATLRGLCVAELELDSNDVLLDAGCGPGTLTTALAARCRLAIGIDISRAGLTFARQYAKRRNVNNAVFVYGALEEPEAEMRLSDYGINKALIMLSLHHLPENLKRLSIKRIADLMVKPAKIVVGDLIFFEDPLKHIGEWSKVGYDGGITDRPATDISLIDALEAAGGCARIVRHHPLLGIAVADIG